MFDFTVPIPLRDPRYTRAELLDIVPTADQEILNQWIARDMLPLDGESPGKGKRRLFSGADILRIAIVSQMTGFGVSVATGARVAEICLDWTMNHRRPSWIEYFTVETPAYRFEAHMADQHFHSGHAYNQVLGVKGALDDRDGHNVWDVLYPRYHRSAADQEEARIKLRHILHPLGGTRDAKLFVPIGEIINTVLIRLIFREAVENPEILDESGLRAIIDGEGEE